VLNSQLGDANVEDFLTEARTIAHLVHPHIIRIFDFDVHEGTPFLVMDYASNGTLRKRHLQGIPLPFTTLIDYVRQVANALQYAHDQKIIHRDIKPENMLIGRYDEIQLSDFGIALMAQSSHIQSTQEVAGTAHYMAPEQLKGKPRLASDQYSLGVVVYEWLTGTHPFKGTFSEIASQHMFVLPPSLREKIPDISPEIEQIVLTALAKDPHQRFASVRAFATALEQASQPIQSSSFSLDIALDYPSQLFSQSSPIRIPLVEHPDSVTSTSLQDASSASTDQATSASFNFTPPISLSQVSIPITPSEIPLEQSNLEVQPMQEEIHHTKQGISRRTGLIALTGTAITILLGGSITWLVHSQKPSLGTILLTYTGHSSTVYAVAWSPDGHRIASGSDDYSAQVWDASNGQTLVSYTGNFSTVYAVAWSPDGQRLASGSSDNTAQVWDASSGQTLLTYADHSNAVLTLAWSPDGHHIASGSSDNTVRVWNASNGQTLLTYTGHSGVINAVAWSPDGQRLASGSSDNTVKVWQAI
jgi:eukaryotic-like serine/threonine-protein kinase